MKKIATLFILFTSYWLHSQNEPIQSIRLTKTKIVFSLIDSTKSQESYKRISEKEGFSFYKCNEGSIYINPFVGDINDSLTNRQLLNFIKRNYDFDEAKKRYAFGSGIEMLTLVIKVDTNGKIVNFGFAIDSGEKLFQQEIYTVLEKLDSSQITFPVFVNDNIEYGYIKMFQITNYDLYEEIEVEIRD